MINTANTVIEERAKDRATTIEAIRKALKARSGKTWSVSGGRGTAWGWIKVDAPTARRTMSHRLKPGCNDWPDNYEEYDTGEAGHLTTRADREQLASLLGMTLSECQTPVSIPADYHYRQEYIDRAEGRAPRVIGTPYWD